MKGRSPQFGDSCEREDLEENREIILQFARDDKDVFSIGGARLP